LILPLSLPESVEYRPKPLELRTKAKWRNGLRLFQEAAAKSSVADALAQAAAHEDRPTTDLERFFSDLKLMTVDGYYTSEIGIHKDLEYMGNTYLASFPGCERLE